MKPLSRMPTTLELESIPVAQGLELELSDKEIRQLRYHLYKINKDAIRRYRTLRFGQLLMVWRIQ